MIQRNNYWVEKAQELKETQERLKFLKEKKAELELELRSLSNNVDSYGEGYKYKIFSRPGSVDYKLIPELKEIDLDKYRRDDVEFWKLSYTKQF